MAQRQPQEPQGPDEPARRVAESSRGGGREDTSSWYRLAGIGFEFIAAVGGLGAIGWWLDRQFNTGPWLLIGGFGLGFAAGLFLMVRAANRMFRD
jgi:F0F1-type ATP synthase assembly protein I